MFKEVHRISQQPLGRPALAWFPKNDSNSQTRQDDRQTRAKSLKNFNALKQDVWKKELKALILLNLLVTQANEGNCKGDNIERVQGKAEKVQ